MTDQRKYQFVKNNLLELIASGEFQIGEKIPTEFDLAEKFNVSRGTIRKAIMELADDAIVTRRAGIGTFVLRRPVQEFHIRSFTAHTLSLGKVPLTKLISSAPILLHEANDRVRTAFRQVTGSNPKSYLFRIERLRLADALPVSWQITYVSKATFKDEFFHEDFTTSLFELYQKYGHKVSWADEVIQARIANQEEIKRFEMDELPLEKRILYIRHRISYDQANIPIEVVISHDRGDFFETYHYRIQEEYPPNG